MGIFRIKIMQKKKILIFCYRFYDFRLWLMTGLLASLAQKYDVSILCPGNLTETLKNHLGENAAILSYRENEVYFTSKIREKIHGFCVHIFSMTYASKGSHINRSASFHRSAFIKKAREQGIKESLPRFIIVWFSQIASLFPPLRKLIAWIYMLTKPENPFGKILRDVKPDLTIAATFGQEQDGIFLTEARENNIKTLVAIQSWDKTSSKGYPFLFSDHMIVWNEPSRQEAIDFLGFPSNRVWAEGSPVWDNFFSKDYIFTKEQFLQEMGLKAGYKTVFVALNSWSYHEGNKNLIALLADSLKNRKFDVPVQILIRQHPSYDGEQLKKDDLEKFIAPFRSVPGLHFSKPETMYQEQNFLYHESDSRLQASCFAHCDVTLSSVSTFMIESAIFDRPAINIEYGRWVNDTYDFDISEYKAEHILRIYDYGATYRAFNADQLIQFINHALKNPDEKRRERAQLVEQEAGINKGASGQAYLNRINNILDVG
ncbi:MAG: hypothetical protein DYH13_07950 [Alphaproteobacteria bacterium PRO2]|nr:hypothetical protein [Alphaproteobacteria bacterium PRO2]